MFKSSETPTPRRVTMSKIKVTGYNMLIGTHGKVLSQGILMWNIKVLALIGQKLLARLKFQIGGQHDRMDKNNMPPDLVLFFFSPTRDIHMKYQSSITHCSKVISRVEVFKKWFKLQCHRVKLILPTERSCHKEYSCEITICSTHWSKVN